MKLIEKLAIEYIQDHDGSYHNAHADAFKAGFRKAREMAAELAERSIACQHVDRNKRELTVGTWIFLSPNLLELGEEAV